jgi:pimeloyl-ACP methyl ester carboxylesterase
MTWPWRTATVASGGEDIYYEVIGDDPAMPWAVLTHGAGGSHAAWFQQVPVLAQHFRVVTWDCRGFGRSTFQSGVLSAEASARDLLAVMDATGVDRAHLVAQSMGGWWATEATVTAPERVRSLVLCDTIGGLYTDALERALAEFVTRAASEAERPPVVGGHAAIDAGLADRDLARAFLYQQLGTFFTPPLGAMIGALDQGRRTHAEVDATGLPVMVLAGEHDPIFPAPLLRESAALLATGSYVEIAGGGHSPYFERPDEWNEAVLPFLREH